MSNLDPNQERKIIKKFESLSAVPPRDTTVAASGREAFLSKALEISQAVSNQPKRRLNSNLNRARYRTLTTAIALLVLFFTSSVMTAYASQSALPGETLYPVKILTENVRLAAALDAETKIQLHLSFAESRLAEIASLLSQGDSDLVEDTGRNLLQHAGSAADLLSKPSAALDQQPRLSAVLNNYHLLKGDDDLSPTDKNGQETVPGDEDGDNDDDASGDNNSSADDNNSTGNDNNNAGGDNNDNSPSGNNDNSGGNNDDSNSGGNNDDSIQDDNNDDSTDNNNDGNNEENNKDNNNSKNNNEENDKNDN